MHWAEFSDISAELATAVRARFEANLHHVIATLGRDGSPRASGTEVRWWNEDIWLGSMPGSRKSADLKRDPRYSIHSHPDSGELLDGDAKLAGTVELVDDATTRQAYSAFIGHPGDDPYDLFRLAVSSASLVKVSDDQTHLVITSWTETTGTTTIDRY
jgi:hypothetical protein